MYLFVFVILSIDSEAIQREEEAIKIDELNVAQMKELRDKVKSFTYLFF